MRQKKAKQLRKIARKMCADFKRPQDTQRVYKDLKKAHKANKGEI